LAQAFAARRLLDSGSGRVTADVGKRLDSVPSGVLSVTFAFVCTGRASLTLKLAAGGKTLKLAAGGQTSPEGVVPCDGSIFQQSLDVLHGSVSFDATVASGASGGFAYGFYVEKTQLPS
jgi:hypothetical protein